MNCVSEEACCGLRGHSGGGDWEEMFSVFLFVLGIVHWLGQVHLISDFGMGFRIHVVDGWALMLKICC